MSVGEANSFRRVCKILEKRLLASSCLSVCLSVAPSACVSAWNNFTSTGGIFMKFNILVFYENL